MDALLAAAAASSGVAGNGLEAAVLAAAAAAVCATILVCRRFQPVAYRIEPDGLVIERRAGAKAFSGPVGAPQAGRLALRIVGSGGLGGYLGVFTLDGGGRARAYVTDRGRAVIVPVGGREVAISPAEAIGGADA